MKFRLKQDHNNSFLNDSMLKWIARKSNKIFTLESMDDKAVKAYRVSFWITKDLIEFI